MRTKRKLKKGYKRVLDWENWDGSCKPKTLKIVSIVGRGKFKRGVRSRQESAKKLKGKISRRYRVTDNDEKLQREVIAKVKYGVMKELGLW